MNVQTILDVTRLAERCPDDAKAKNLTTELSDLVGEFSWFFEAFLDDNRCPRDWKLMSQLLADKKSTIITPFTRRGLEIRRHIWSRNVKLLPLIRLHSHEIPKPLMPPWAIDDDEFPADRWEIVAGNLGGACRELFSYQFRLPNDVESLSISTIVVGYFTYVCGLSFLTLSGQNLKVRYNNTDQAESWTYLEPAGLTGLNVAVGESGIHALQCVNPTGPVGDWLGQHHRIAKTKRIGGANAISAPKVGFDVNGIPSTAKTCWMIG